MLRSFCNRSGEAKMRAMNALGFAVLLAVGLAACGDIGWRKYGGGTVSQFNDDSYACKLTAARAASAGPASLSAPLSDSRSGCTSRGEGLTACKPASESAAARPSSSAADATAEILERGWRECMHERGWREVEAGGKSAAK
jgi:hypothetical protein